MEVFQRLNQKCFQTSIKDFVQVCEVNYQALSSRFYVPTFRPPDAISFQMYGGMFGHGRLYRYTNVFLGPPYICRLKAPLPTGRIFFNKQFSDCACVTHSNVLTQNAQNNTDEEVLWPMTGLFGNHKDCQKITTKENLRSEQRPMVVVKILAYHHDYENFRVLCTGCKEKIVVSSTVPLKSMTTMFKHLNKQNRASKTMFSTFCLLNKHEDGTFFSHRIQPENLYISVPNWNIASLFYTEVCPVIKIIGRHQDPDVEILLSDFSSL